MKHVLLAILLVVALPGCSIFSNSHPKMVEVWPVYQIPAQPKLDIPPTMVPGKSPELDSAIKNLYTVIQYTETLKIIVETHNTAARAHNRQVENNLGIGK